MFYDWRPGRRYLSPELVFADINAGLLYILAWTGIYGYYCRMGLNSKYAFEGRTHVRWFPMNWQWFTWYAYWWCLKVWIWAILLMANRETVWWIGIGFRYFPCFWFIWFQVGWNESCTIWCGWRGIRNVAGFHDYSGMAFTVFSYEYSIWYWLQPWHPFYSWAVGCHRLTCHLRWYPDCWRLRLSCSFRFVRFSATWSDYETGMENIYLLRWHGMFVGLIMHHLNQCGYVSVKYLVLNRENTMIKRTL